MIFSFARSSESGRCWHKTREGRFNEVQLARAGEIFLSKSDIAAADSSDLGKRSSTLVTIHNTV
jgi:hypothetical protein